MDFLDSEKKAYEKNPENYEKTRKEDARQMYKDVDRYENERLMKRAEEMAKSKEARSSGIRGGGMGGAGVIPGIKGGGTKNPNFEMKKGGVVSSASKRADGCCVKGKTKGKIV